MSLEILCVLQLCSVPGQRKPSEIFATQICEDPVELLAENCLNESCFQLFGVIMVKCGGSDSNARTPTRLGPQPSAFDLARQPPHRSVR